MWTLSLSCVECAFRRYGSTTSLLLDANDHVEETGHVVRMSGQASRMATPKRTADEVITDGAVAKRVREAQIMRIARDRGLV